VSVSTPTPEVPDPADFGPLPPLNIEAVQRAREIISDPTSQLCTVEEMRDLLGAYDNLALRLSIVAATAGEKS
jgi:hypothetical protein